MLQVEKVKKAVETAKQLRPDLHLEGGYVRQAAVLPCESNQGMHWPAPSRQTVG